MSDNVSTTVWDSSVNDHVIGRMLKWRIRNIFRSLLQTLKILKDYLDGGSCRVGLEKEVKKCDNRMPSSDAVSMAKALLVLQG